MSKFCQISSIPRPMSLTSTKCKLVRRQLAAAIEFPLVASGRSWNDGYVEERWFSGGILKIMES